MERIFMQIGQYVDPIFYRLVYTSIKALILGIAILLIKKSLKNKISKQWVCIIWFTFIFCLLVPVGLRTNFSIYNLIPVKIENIETFNPAYEETIKTIVEQTKNSQNAELQKSNNYTIFSVLSLIWATAALSYILIYLFTYIFIELKLINKKIENERLKNILNDCKKELNIRRHITLVNQNLFKMPSIYGIFNIRILINDRIMTLSDTEIHNIFIHELSHFERKDNIFNLIIIFIRGIYIFNPLILFLLSEIRTDVEFATDEYALTYVDKNMKKEYSKTLLKLVNLDYDNFFVQTLSFVNRKGVLEKRIENIKQLELYVNEKKKIKRLSIVIILILFIVFITRGNNYRTQNEMLSLCEKFNDYSNIKMHRTTIINDDKYETDFYWKDGIHSSKSSEGYSYQAYYGTAISVLENEKKIWVDNGAVAPVPKLDVINTLLYSDYTGARYKYLGIEKLDSKKVYKVFVKSYFQDYWQICWIDCKNGLIYKKETKIPDVDDTQVEYYSYEFDTVTDNDIIRPYPQNYPDYEVIYK